MSSKPGLHEAIKGARRRLSRCFWPPAPALQTTSRSFQTVSEGVFCEVHYSSLPISSQEVRLHGGLGALMRAHHQHRAGGLTDNRIRDAPLDGPPYPATASASHDDHVRLELPGQAYDL